MDDQELAWTDLIDFDQTQDVGVFVSADPSLSSVPDENPGASRQEVQQPSQQQQYIDPAVLSEQIVPTITDWDAITTAPDVNPSMLYSDETQQGLGITGVPSTVQAGPYYLSNGVNQYADPFRFPEYPTGYNQINVTQPVEVSPKTLMNSDVVYYSYPQDFEPLNNGGTQSYQNPVAPQAQMYASAENSSQRRHERPNRYAFRPSSSRTRQASDTTDSSRRKDSNSTVSVLDEPDGHKNKRRKTTGTKVAKKYEPEKPRIDPEHAWVRINGRTEGKSARTGKINNWKPESDGAYETTRHPTGTWKSSSNFEFEYKKAGELSKLTFSIKEMKEFIYDHPRGKRSGLVIWIQKNAADSAARYNSPNGSKCRFKDCPFATLRNSGGVGTIRLGSYRVALDDQWKKYGELHDPFVVAGYAHLYCMERFLDFPDICNRFDVKVDDRRISGEPNGNFGPCLVGEPEFGVACNFVDACKNRQFRQKFPNYPLHSWNGERKDFENTLTCAMTETKIKHLPPSRTNMYLRRGLKDTQFLKHKGDLEMLKKALRLEQEERDQKREEKKEKQTQDATVPNRQVLNTVVEEPDESGNGFADLCSALQSHTNFLTDSSQSLGKRKRTNHAQDEYTSTHNSGIYGETVRNPPPGYVAASQVHAQGYPRQLSLAYDESISASHQPADASASSFPMDDILIDPLILALSNGINMPASDGVGVNTTASDGVGVTTTESDGVGVTTTESDGVGVTTTVSDSVGVTTTASDSVGVTTTASDSVGVTTTASDGVGVTTTDSQNKRKLVPYPDSDDSDDSDDSE